MPWVPSPKSQVKVVIEPSMSCEDDALKLTVVLNSIGSFGWYVKLAVGGCCSGGNGATVMVFDVLLANPSLSVTVNVTL